MARCALLAGVVLAVVLGVLVAGGSRARQSARPWVRRRRLVLYVTDRELADVRRLAAAWDVSAAAAGWAILAERLARWRKAEPQLGRVGFHLVAAASMAGMVFRPRAGRRCSRCRRALPEAEAGEGAER